MTDSAAPEQPSILEFPVHFPIKVMGKSHPDLTQTLTEVVLQHMPDFDPASVETRTSGKGNYIGLTFTVHAQSREQLDNLYRALTSHEMTAYVL